MNQFGRVAAYMQRGQRSYPEAPAVFRVCRYCLDQTCVLVDQFKVLKIGVCVIIGASKLSVRTYLIRN